MNIHIILSKPKKFSLVSLAIRYVLNTEYSHVCIGFHWRDINKFMVFEANRNGVVLSNISKWLEHNKIVKKYTLNITKQQYLDMLEFIASRLAIKYGFIQIVGILISRIFHLNRNIEGDGQKTEVCSELVAYILLKLFGYRINKDFDLVDPKDIENLLEYEMNRLKK